MNDGFGSIGVGGHVVCCAIDSLVLVLPAFSKNNGVGSGGGGVQGAGAPLNARDWGLCHPPPPPKKMARPCQVVKFITC